MQTVEVPVTFNGTVTVLVPHGLTEEDRQLLATKKALAQVLATVENHDNDTALSDACDEYAAEARSRDEERSKEAFDDAEVYSVSGTWTSTGEAI